MQTEDPEALRCFTPPFRPARVMTTVRWVRARAEALAGAVALPAADAWPEERERKLALLRELLRLPSPMPAARPPFQEAPPRPAPERFEGLLRSEEGVLVPLAAAGGGRIAGAAGTVLLLHPGGRAAALETPVARALRESGTATVALELRGCGELEVPRQNLGDRIPDHNLVEWSLWIGRPLLGQWVHDALRALAALPALGLDPGRMALLGWREAGLAALLAAALDGRVRGAAAVETLATYVSETEPHGQRMVVFQPDLLKVGDVPHLAALAAPRPVLLASPARLDGMAATEADLSALHRWPRALYGALGAGNRFTARAAMPDAGIAAAVRGWLLTA